MATVVRRHNQTACAQARACITKAEPKLEFQILCDYMTYTSCQVQPAVECHDLVLNPLEQQINYFELMHERLGLLPLPTCCPIQQHGPLGLLHSFLGHYIMHKSCCSLTLIKPSLCDSHVCICSSHTTCTCGLSM